MTHLETKLLPEKPDEIAPDGSEIRLLLALKGGGLCHCTLPVGGVSKPIQHRSVEEIWYFLEGVGQVWRKQDGLEEVTVVHPGVSLSIPTGCHFQFKNTGAKPLGFVIVTMPPWPEPYEAVKLDAGYWPTANEDGV